MVWTSFFRCKYVQIRMKKLPLILVSNTETLISLLKLRLSISICATLLNSVLFPITAKVSSASTNVNE